MPQEQNPTKGKESAETETLQIRFEPDILEIFRQIKGSTGLPNTAEILRIAILWLEFSVDQLSKGDQLAIRHADGSWSELQMPFRIRASSNPGA